MDFEEVKHNYQSETKTFWEKYRFVILIIILAVVLSTLGGGGYNYHRETVKALEKQNLRLNERLLEADEVKRLADERVKNIDNEYNRIYKNWKYEKRLRTELQKAINGIDTLRFDFVYLDSLAKHIKYR